MLDVRSEKQWLTAAEAAAEQLPGFAYDERQIRRLICSGELRGRNRIARGGGREFHWTDLPHEARTEYLKRHGVAVATADPATRDRDLEAEARAAIVEAGKSFIAARKGTVAKKVAQYCARYNARGLHLDAWIYETIPAIAPHRVCAWERKIRSGGTKALVDGRGRPKGGSWIEDDADLRLFIVGTFAARPHLSATAIRAAVKVEKNRDVPLRTLQAFLATLKKNNRAVVKALTDPDRARSHHKPAFGSLSQNVTRINQLWQIDATRADVMCLTAEGTRRRCNLTAIIDVLTRRARVVVSDQPRALATQALLRRAIAELGLPEVLKADNGKEYKNRAVERFCHDAGIRLVYSRAFCPEQKGHIERFFRTLSHGFLELLPDYVAHDVTGRKAIESRRSFSQRFKSDDAQLVMETSLSPAELQARIDAWLANVYEQRPHESIGMTPAAKALAHAGEEKRIPDMRALDVLLFEAPDGHGIRVVGKRGVRVNDVFYVADELGEYMGQRVQVKLDPLDPTTAIIYRADRNQFLCVARDAESLSGSERAQVARGAIARWNGLNARVRADARKVHRLHPPARLADRMLQQAANVFPSSPSGASAGHARIIGALPTAGGTENGAGEPFTLSGESARAMATASAPALLEHARAADAIEQSKSVPKPRELTVQDRADAVAFLDSVTPKLPAPELVQCEGYTRPFIEDDVEFYRWLEAHQSTLDAQDRAQFEEWRASHSFQLLIQQRAARERGLRTTSTNTGVAA